MNNVTIVFMYWYWKHGNLHKNHRFLGGNVQKSNNIPGGNVQKSNSIPWKCVKKLQICEQTCTFYDHSHGSNAMAMSWEWLQKMRKNLVRLVGKHVCFKGFFSMTQSALW